MKPLKSLSMAINSMLEATPKNIKKARKNALNKVINGWTVDTCIGYDTGEWETGIKPKNGNWIIVQQYNSKEEAIKGHKEYINKIKKGETNFKDIDIWGLNEEEDEGNEECQEVENI